MTEPSLPRQSLREAQRELTRQRLLDAASQVFQASGYENTTVEAIVAVAGVSRATFYLHFDSKADVMTALTADWVPSALPLYRELDEMLSRDDRPAVRQWVENALRWMSDRPVNRAHLEARLIEPRFQRDAEDMLDALVDAMPRTASGDPAQKRVVRLRLQFLTILLNAGEQMYRDRAGEADCIADAITDLWFEALHVRQAR